MCMHHAWKAIEVYTKFELVNRKWSDRLDLGEDLKIILK
jgi:hypothetical protein